jgi:hypothetical protein
MANYFGKTAQRAMAKKRARWVRGGSSAELSPKWKDGTNWLVNTFDKIAQRAMAKKRERWVRRGGSAELSPKWNDE